jgi:serine/threonine protein kinase
VAERNVVRDRDKRGVLGGFGTARLLGKSQDDRVYQWLAPEQFAEPRPYTPATDVYQLGVTIWELLTGDVPYDGLPRDEVSARVVDGSLRPERLRKEKCPSAVWELVQRCWAGEAAARPTAREVCETLRAMM